MVVTTLWTAGEFRRWGCVIFHGDDSGSLVDRWGVEEGLWGIEAEPPFGLFIRFEVRMASFVVIRHGVAGLAMEGAVGFVAEVGLFQRVGVGLSAVGNSARGEDYVIALANKALVEESGK
jgi:hypothetical protein